MSIGINIKKRRFELRMSQQDLANAMGYKTRSTIAKIESGENSVSIRKLEKFAVILDTTVEDLIGYKKEPSNFNSTLTLDNEKEVIAIILAGGKSTRNQHNIPNQFISVLGKPVIIYPIEAYQKHPSISSIYIVCLKGWEDIVASYVNEYSITKLKGIIPGGDSTILSIKNSVDFLKEKTSPSSILIFQESTRPLVSEDIISKIIACSQEKGSAVCSKKMSDYMQFMDYGSSSRYMDRKKLISLQSPEAYSLNVLNEAFEKAEKNDHIYDESFGAMFFFNMGYSLNFCESNYNNNIKIIRQEDIAILSALIKQQD